jgi:HEAT repeat protein
MQQWTWRVHLKSKAIGLALVLWSASLFALTTKPQATVDSLMYDLKSPNPARRKEAVNNLGERRVKTAIPEIVAAARDPDTEVRRAVVIALDRMLDMGSQPGFVALSSDADKDIRDRCIIGLLHLYIPQGSGLTGTLDKVANYINPWSDEWAEVVIEPGIPVADSTISALRDRLQDTEGSLRLKAARALGILKGRAAVPAMLDLLRRDEDGGTRYEVIRALRKIGDPTAGPDLAGYLAYGDSKIRNEAIFAIGRLKYRQAVPEMAQLLEKELALLPKLQDRTYCETLLDAIASVADPASKDLFLREKMNPNDTMRLHATEGLARIVDPAMVSDMSSDWLKEKDVRVKTAQAFALFRMGRREYLDEVVKSLGDGKAKSEARMLLLELKPAELPELYGQVKQNDADVRSGLAEVLGWVGDERAIPVLQNLSQDRRDEIAARAYQAIQRIKARGQGGIGSDQ